jgi:hypothetical protein
MINTIKILLILLTLSLGSVVNAQTQDSINTEDTVFIFIPKIHLYERCINDSLQYLYSENFYNTVFPNYEAQIIDLKLEILRLDSVNQGNKINLMYDYNDIFKSSYTPSFYFYPPYFRKNYYFNLDK